VLAERRFLPPGPLRAAAEQRLFQIGNCKRAKSWSANRIFQDTSGRKERNKNLWLTKCKSGAVPS
jgi:hypothetical protein